MWSHFTDLALKAQKDLQEQANEAAQALQHTAPPVVNMGSFFNLDAMQQPSENKKNESVVPNSLVSAPIAPPISSTDDAADRAGHTTNTPLHSSNIVQEEKSSNLLDETPSPKEESIVSEHSLETAAEVDAMASLSPTDPHIVDVVEKDVPVIPSTVMADDEDDDSSSVVYPVATPIAASATFMATEASLGDVHEELPQNETDLAANIIQPGILDTTLSLPSLPKTLIEDEESNIPVTTDDYDIDEEELPFPQNMPVESSPPDVDQAKDGNVESPSAVTMTYLPLSPSPSKTRWTKKLLILISTNSIDRQVKVRQDLVQTALTAAGIDFDCLDGSVTDDDEAIVLRNELFALSGLRGIYPQFFLVDLVHGGTTFWGTFTEFQHANDDGQLQSVFGSDIDIAGKNLEGINPVSASSITDSKQESHPARTSTGVPDDLLEGFSNQIKRIEENYQIERDETEQRHSIEIEKLTSMYSACVQSKNELEERLQLEIKMKEEQLNEALRRNEGHRLKLDVLKREVSGTQELLHSRELEIKKLNEKHLHDLRAIEKHGVVAERKAEKLEVELEKVQKSMQVTEDEFIALKGEHETLVQRAKSIAAELKDRRAEGRHLESIVDQETQKNQLLQQTISSLEERLNHQGMSQTEKDSEMDQLRTQLTDAKRDIEQVEKAWREKEAKSELVLTEYKKRAQHSLSMANSRTASAVQAREEAELDARSARSTADAALERANKAEIASREAILEAQTRIDAMMKERNDAVASLDHLKGEMNSIELKLTSALHELEQLRTIEEKKDVEVDRLRNELDVAETKTVSTQQKLIESVNLVETLREEIVVLRDQLQHATVQAAENVTSTEKADTNDFTESRYKATFMNGSHDEGDDSALAALRSELSEANDAIEDLKTALKNALEQNEHKLEQHPNESSTSGESIPLFYAMEKQAELKTARAEMNRLANLIADVQSEKMEAYEAMDDMRRKMEDAEARLKRFEKLGTLATSETPGITEDEINTAVNIEYLKHIMLRFMNAKSLTEKKTLVPVIAAVLELTPDEAQAAMSSIDHNPTTGVVGSKLFGFMS